MLRSVQDLGVYGIIHTVTKKIVGVFVRFFVRRFIRSSSIRARVKRHQREIKSSSKPTTHTETQTFCKCIVINATRSSSPVSLSKSVAKATSSKTRIMHRAPSTSMTIGEIFDTV
jgi:hypothetical protein